MRVLTILAVLAAVIMAAAAPAQSLAGKIICIDPGHISENGRGTTGKLISELRANWLVAIKLKAALQARGARVVMTKTDLLEKVSNRRRAEIGNASGAHLVVRLHCDSAGGPGIALYYPSKTGKVGGVSGPSSMVIAASSRAAKAMYPVIVAALAGKVKAKGLRTDSQTYIGGKQGALTGSIYSKVPVVLIEMVTMTHASDDRFIASPEGQAAMARAIAAGVDAAL